MASQGRLVGMSRIEYQTPDQFPGPPLQVSNTLASVSAATPKTQSVPALERGLNILEYVANSPHGLTHSQLTRKLQLPRSTCHALLLTFERCGYLERDHETGRYRLAFKLYTLGNQSLSKTRLRDLAASILHQLALQTGLTAHLAIAVESEAVLIDKVDAPGTSKVASWIGKRVGLHCTALGKALIAYLPEKELCSLVLKQGLLRHNENTICSLKKLKRACEEVRQSGYAIEAEEEGIGTRAIAAPVLDSTGKVVTAIGISGPAAQVENIAKLSSQVRKASLNLQCQLDPARIGSLPEALNPVDPSRLRVIQVASEMRPANLAIAERASLPQPGAGFAFCRVSMDGARD